MIAVAVDERLGQTTSSSARVRRGPTKRDHAMDLICQETQCLRSAAGNSIDWIAKIVQEARRLDYAPVILTQKQLKSRYYKIFDKVMPHGKSSQPGSAHEAIEAVVLDSNLKEFSLIHNMQSPSEGEPGYCNLQVCFEVFSS